MKTSATIPKKKGKDSFGELIDCAQSILLSIV
jgi:hypothetical protein